MLEASKMLFKLLKFDWNLYKQIEENLKSSYFELVAEKVFGTDCLWPIKGKTERRLYAWE